MNHDFNFWHELFRRRVLRTTAAYAVLAFVVVQLVAGSAEYFAWPAATVRTAIWFAIAGAPVVAVLAWLFDFTPWGILKTPPRGELPLRKTGLIDYRVEAVIIFVLLIGLGIAIRGTFDELTQRRVDQPRTDELRTDALGHDAGAVQGDQAGRLEPPQAVPRKEQLEEQ